MTRADRIKVSWTPERKAAFVPPMKGKKMSDESRHKMSVSAKRHPSNFLGKKHSPETRKKISDATKALTPRGADHYAYSHGKHQRDKCDRRTTEYKQWRDAVYARDKYTCKVCGDATGGNLQAHHIKDFASHPLLRFDVANGVTVCRECHERIHLKPIPTPADLRRRKKHLPNATG